MTTDLREKIAEVLAGHTAMIWPDGAYSCRVRDCTFSALWGETGEEAELAYRRHVAEAILAAIGDPRAEALKIAARALLGEASAYDEKWCRKRVAVQAHLDWDRGYVRGMQAAAHSVANGIDRPEWLAEFAERHAAALPVDTEDPISGEADIAAPVPEPVPDLMAALKTSLMAAKAAREDPRRALTEETD